MLEREAAKTALDLNAASAEFQSVSSSSRRAGSRVRQPAGGVLSPRSGAHRSAPESRGAASSITSARAAGSNRSRRQIGGIENRLGQGDVESQELERRQQRSERSWKHNSPCLPSSKLKPTPAEAWQPTTGSAKSCNSNCRKARARLESGRQQVLRSSAKLPR